MEIRMSRNKHLGSISLYDFLHEVDVIEHQGANQGAHWVILRGGPSHICNRKDEIKHGLSPSVKCIVPSLFVMSIVKVLNAGGGTSTQPPQKRP